MEWVLMLLLVGGTVEEIPFNTLAECTAVKKIVQTINSVEKHPVYASCIKRSLDVFLKVQLDAERKSESYFNRCIRKTAMMKKPKKTKKAKKAKKTKKPVKRGY